MEPQFRGHVRSGSGVVPSAGQMLSGSRTHPSFFYEHTVHFVVPVVVWMRNSWYKYQYKSTHHGVSLDGNILQVSLVTSLSQPNDYQEYKETDECLTDLDYYVCVSIPVFMYMCIFVCTIISEKRWRKMLRWKITRCNIFTEIWSYLAKYLSVSKLWPKFG